MNPAVPRPIVSEAESRRLPESTAKVEVLDGEVVVSPSPIHWHQEIVGRLIVALRLWVETQSRPVTAGHAPLDVRFAPRRDPAAGSVRALRSVSARQRGPRDRIPELCIEVLRQDRVHDRVTKRLNYAAAGVKEHWVVEPAGLIERWTGKSFERAEYLCVRRRWVTGR